MLRVKRSLGFVGLSRERRRVCRSRLFVSLLLLLCYLFLSSCFQILRSARTTRCQRGSWNLDQYQKLTWVASTESCVLTISPKRYLLSCRPFSRKTMWSFASSAFGGKLSSKSASIKSSISNPDCSDDDISSCTSKEEGLECPICWESFNIVENVPYVLWCGHTLCKNCVLGLQRAVVKLPTIPVRLPLFVSCPWCNLLSFRLVYKGNLTIPRKNYFILWMVESKNNERSNSLHSVRSEHHSLWPTNGSIPGSNTYQHHNSRGAPIIHAADSNSNQRHAGRAGDFSNAERIHASLRKFLASFVQLIAKLPLVIIFLLIVLYAIPASAVILALYILITVLFALPSFLVLYFAYPGLDWLIKEIFT